MDLWSQDTHLGPGFREKSVFYKKTLGKHVLEIPKRYQSDCPGKGVCCSEHFKQHPADTSQQVERNCNTKLNSYLIK